MQIQNKRSDICPTCNHVTECNHYRNCQSRGESIFYCEDFENRPPIHIVEGAIADNHKHHPETSKTSVGYVQGRMKGLCINCDKREMCRYPAPAGGVWHCEEHC